MSSVDLGPRRRTGGGVVRFDDRILVGADGNDVDVSGRHRFRPGDRNTAVGRDVLSFLVGVLESVIQRVASQLGAFLVAQPEADASDVVGTGRGDRVDDLSRSIDVLEANLEAVCTLVSVPIALRSNGVPTRLDVVVGDPEFVERLPQVVGPFSEFGFDLVGAFPDASTPTWSLASSGSVSTSPLALTSIVRPAESPVAEPVIDPSVAGPSFESLPSVVSRHPAVAAVTPAADIARNCRRSIRSITG